MPKNKKIKSLYYNTPTTTSNHLSFSKTSELCLFPKLDAIVNFEGKIYLNKDFGAGYRYDIIMEEAKMK